MTFKINAQKTVKEAAKKLLDSPWKEKNFYASYLAQTFYYVKHSTRILALSAGRLNYENYQKTHLRFLGHLNEEANHEKMALKDLENLGHKISDHMELYTTKQFYESQYYKIDYQNPMAIMGYILFLEMLAQESCNDLVKILHLKYTPKACSFLRVHGSEDPEHVEHAWEVINNLNDRDLEAVEDNFFQSAYAYMQMLEELEMRMQKNSIRKSA